MKDWALGERKVGEVGCSYEEDCDWRTSYTSFTAIAYGVFPILPSVYT
jgi:hypothetical protein